MLPKSVFDGIGLLCTIDRRPIAILSFLCRLLSPNPAFGGSHFERAYIERLTGRLLARYHADVDAGFAIESGDLSDYRHYT
jgi:hypothetical protein